jgi:hypothetical protein
MRKASLLITLLLICVSSAYSVNFTPPVMKITAPSSIMREFEGRPLNLPVTVSGSPAAAYFLLFTHNKGASINKIRNGYLGWHYVNHIDTCLYISSLKQLSIGNNSIFWDGRDEAGNIVHNGTYYYYVWGFDNTSIRIPVTKSLTFQPWGFMTLTTKDATGANITQPFLTQGGQSWPDSLNPHAQQIGRWVIGGDPMDATLLQTTTAMSWNTCGGVAYLPGDYNMFFIDGMIGGGGTKITRKYRWVPGGPSVLQTDWGVDGEYRYSGAWPLGWNYGPGCVSDGGDYLFVTNADVYGTGTESKLIYLNINDGTEIKRLDLAEWWVNPDDGIRGGQICGGPTELSMQKGVLGLGSVSSCVNQVIDPYYTDAANAVLWSNTNGDFIGDHNWEPGSEKAWVCTDANVGPWKYNFTLDSNGFAAFPSFGYGVTSFGLYASDGTGLSYLAMAGETAYQKYGVLFVDYGSAYDGLYCTSNIGSTGDIDSRVFWVGHSTCKGIIGIFDDPDDDVTEAPAAFSISQNVPNPFNPTTTISFTTAKTGKVTVDVFNVAGQKVATLVNGPMNAGSHSVTWNASKFSAGVYFYTVKAGGVSRTMKMTLIK